MAEREVGPPALKRRDLEPQTQVFSWFDDRRGKVRHWSVPHLTALVLQVLRDPEVPDDFKAFAETNAPTSKRHADWARENRGIEQHRLDRIDAERCKTPIIALFMTDGTHLIVDGIHRFVWATDNGLESLPCYRLPEEFAVGAEFEEDVTAEQFENYVKNGFSGIG